MLSLVPWIYSKRVLCSLDVSQRSKSDSLGLGRHESQIHERLWKNQPAVLNHHVIIASPSEGTEVYAMHVLPLLVHLQTSSPPLACGPSLQSILFLLREVPLQALLLLQSLPLEEAHVCVSVSGSMMLALMCVSPSLALGDSTETLRSLGKTCT